MKKQSSTQTLAIIGGGAAGLFLAAQLCELPDLKIKIYEKQARVGKKILLSGNGKCNLSNFDMQPKHYDSHIALDIIKDFDVAKTTAFFEKIGLMLKTEGTRVYPVSESASSVLDCLRNYYLARGVEEITSFDVAAVQKQGDKYCIIANNGTTATSDFVALALGSSASQKDYCNSLLQDLDLKTKPFQPVLLPLPTKEKIIALSGIRVKAELKSADASFEAVRGEVLFRDNALSGIASFEMSFFLNKIGKYPAKIILDLLYDVGYDELVDRLTKRAATTNADLENFMTGIFHRRINDYVLAAAKIGDKKTKANSLGKSDLKKLAFAIKNLQFTITQPTDLKNAQSAAGGVELDQIDPKTMQSKKHSNLFVLGEMLDLVGNCGGYNLQLCWSQSALTAQHLKSL